MRIENEDDYSPSDSEEEYTENEKKILSKVRNRKEDYSDNEQEVFGVGPSDEDEDDEEGDNSDLALSDVEGQEDDDLPDVRAWGKDKRKFYQTDYVDQDYGGFLGKDAHLAEQEEEEARNLQKQLAQQLDDDDFALDIFSKKTKDDEKTSEEIVKTDISKLSKRQKLEIMHKESPEFFNLVEDFNNKMVLAKDFLQPILEKAENGDITQSKAVDFVQTYYELILNYCINIYMYLLLKSSKTNVQNHPLIKRLYQYRQLLLQLESVYQEILKPQIELILSGEDKGDKLEDIQHKKTKTLKLLSNLTNKPKQQEKRKPQEESQPVKVKKVKFDEQTLLSKDRNEIPKDLEDFESRPSEGEELEENIEENDAEESSKRAITYKMAKNKGLTPYRKKELRNPRVKHKLKYRKAIIRRKGAIREARKELSRYSGEISGIKATVSRSVKIKT